MPVETFQRYGPEALNTAPLSELNNSSRCFLLEVLK